MFGLHPNAEVGYLTSLVTNSASLFFPSPVVVEEAAAPRTPLSKMRLIDSLKNYLKSSITLKYLVRPRRELLTLSSAYKKLSV